MSNESREKRFCIVDARRSTRGQNPCQLEVALNEDGELVLRTFDQSGDVPIVALIGSSEALELARGFISGVQLTLD